MKYLPTWLLTVLQWIKGARNNSLTWIKDKKSKLNLRERWKKVPQRKNHAGELWIVLGAIGVALLLIVPLVILVIWLAIAYPLMGIILGTLVVLSIAIPILIISLRKMKGYRISAIPKFVYLVPLALLILHVFGYYSYPRIWNAWIAQDGLFVTFNALVFLSVMFFKQRGFIMSFIGLFFLGFSVITVLSALPTEQWAAESTKASRVTVTQIEAQVGTWEELPSMPAPVGEFIAVPTPQAEEIRNEPQGAVWILPPGMNQKAFLYRPGDPWPNLGYISGPIRYMSAETGPVAIRRWVRR